MKLIEPITNRSEKRFTAFTFMELLVVLAVIAILAVLLFPALASTTDISMRTRCLNNLRQLGIGNTVCANDNNGFFVSAKTQDNDNNTPGNPPFVQYAISAVRTNELNAAGIPLVSNTPSVWSCPSVSVTPYPDFVDYPQWILGYQYFGGITQWTPNGSTSSAIPGTHSPVKLSQCKPYWCLAADLVAKINGTWGGTESLVSPGLHPFYQSLPPHREGTNAIPVGGNELFVDGSACWCRVQTMHNFTSWTSVNQMWFYQSLADMSFGAQIEINTLRWTGGN